MPDDNRSKRYYWLKLRRDFFKRHDIQILEDEDGGDKILLVYLKLLTESIDHDGRLRFSETVPYSNKMLSTITRTSEDIVSKCLDILGQYGLIVREEDGTIVLTNAEKMVGSETSWASKKRQYRELHGARTVSGQKKTMSDKSKSKSKSKSKKEEHELTGMPMNKTRYDRLCKEWGRDTVEKYMNKVSVWADGKGKVVKDAAAYAENFLLRDLESGKIRKPRQDEMVDDSIMKLVRHEREA